jgi:hypothetical protein
VFWHENYLCESVHGEFPQERTVDIDEENIGSMFLARKA